MFIVPLTQLLLRLSNRPYELRAGNPLRHLAMQVAFIVPLTLPVAGGAALSSVLLSGGVACGLVLPHAFTTGGWFTGVALVISAGWMMVERSARPAR